MGEIEMSAVTWASEKSNSKKQRSLMRRFVRGPALILVLCAGSSGALAAALLLSSIFEF
jgi:hypothetical protein